jgi:uncharacterized protein YkwD
MSPSAPRRQGAGAVAAAVLASLLLAFVLVADASAAATPCATATIAAVSAPAPVIARSVRCLVNQQRAAAGLRPLRPNRALRIAAQAHGADMVAHAFFGHVSPFTGAITSRARRAHYMRHHPNWSLGEDIAWGEGASSTPAAIVTAWMNSPAHRQVILTPGFRDVGVGVVNGVPFPSPTAGATFVLDVGSR